MDPPTIGGRSGYVCLNGIEVYANCQTPAPADSATRGSRYVADLRGEQLLSDGALRVPDARHQPARVLDGHRYSSH